MNVDLKGNNVILQLLFEAEEPSGFTVFAFNGIREFLDSVSGAEEDQIVTLFEYVAKYGLPRNRKRCNVLDDGIFELKAGQIRLPFFYDAMKRRVIIVTHHFKKQTQSTPKREIREARRKRSLVEAAQKEGTLTYEEE